MASPRWCDWCDERRDITEQTAYSQEKHACILSRNWKLAFYRGIVQKVATSSGNLGKLAQQFFSFLTVTE